MILKFKNKRITGLSVVLPETEAYFDDEVSNYSFPEKQSMRLKKVMGYEKHRLAKETTSSSDLCVYGLNNMINRGLIKRDEIGAILVVTATPDYFMPHTGNIIHDRCGLGQSVLCMDISQGCSGFVLGLMQSFMLLEHLGDKKVVLFNVDVLSHKVSHSDRNSFPLFGDAATISVVSNCDNEREIVLNIKMDGARGGGLIIPAGGSRTPCNAETAKLVEDDEGNIRSLDHLVMNGSEVFNFVQTDVPPLIEETLNIAGLHKDSIEQYLFHQPNRFMLQKLADRIGIPREKVPMNVVENFGNPSGASIPVAIVHNLSEEMLKNKYMCCLSAFGAGLTWCAMTIEMGEMDFCETLISDL